MDPFDGVIRIDQIIWLIGLVVAFAFVLWGLKLFKIVVVLIGASLGAALGLIVGSLAGLSSQAGGVGAAIGAILLGLLAWPLHKLFMFLSAGALLAFLAVVVAGALKAPPDSWIAVGLVFFVVGGIVVLIVHEYFVIVFMAVSGAQGVMNVIYGKVFSGARSLQGLLRELSAFYTQRLGMLATLVAIYVLYALFVQKFWVARDGDTPRKEARKRRLRRILYWFASIELIGWFGANTLTALPSFGIAPTTGLTLVTWPIAALASAVVLNWIWEATAPAAGGRASFTRALLRYLGFAAVGAAIPPAVTGVLYAALSGRSPYLYLWEAVVQGPPVMLAYKIGYIVVIFPAAMWLATKPAPPTAAAPAAAVPGSSQRPNTAATPAP